MAKISYAINFWGKKERVSSKERETREEIQMRENGAANPLLFFSSRPGHAGA